MPFTTREYDGQIYVPKATYVIRREFVAVDDSVRRAAAPPASIYLVAEFVRYQGLDSRSLVSHANFLFFVRGQAVYEGPAWRHDYRASDKAVQGQLMLDGSIAFNTTDMTPPRWLVADAFGVDAVEALRGKLVRAWHKALALSKKELRDG